MGLKIKKEENSEVNKENVNKDKEKIRTIKNKSKVEGGFTCYLTAFSFLLIGILFKTILAGIGVVLFIMVGAIKSYESYLYGKVIYYSFINKDNKMIKEYKDKLKSFPNSSKILENIRLTNK